MLPAPAAGLTTPFRPSGDGNPPLHATRGKTLKKLSRILALTAALVGAASTAHAQFAKPEDAIKYRQSAYTVLSTHFGRIGAMVNGRIPFDPKVAEGDAAIALVASRLPMAAFGDGTDKGRETRAKPEIWKEKDKFNAGFQKMDEEMVKLNAAAKTGNLDNIKVAFGNTARTCKACHDEYRRD